MCYCGCSDLMVSVCTCGTAEAMRAEITDRLDRGEDEETILAAFISRHGEKILSAPTKEGFNLLAWITPFAALLAAGMTLILLVRRWGAGMQSTVPAGGPHPGDLDDDMSPDRRRILERIEREIREEH